MASAGSQFSVYVERSEDASAQGVGTLARDMAARYGLPVEQLAKRIAAGHMCVKRRANRDTATRLVSELKSLGAVCSILDASASNTNTAAPPSQYQSGLSAAFGTAAPSPQDLGSLDQLTVATLDGATPARRRPPTRREARYVCTAVCADHGPYEGALCSWCLDR